MWVLHTGHGCSAGRVVLGASHHLLHSATCCIRLTGCVPGTHLESRWQQCSLRMASSSSLVKHLRAFRRQVFQQTAECIGRFRPAWRCERHWPRTPPLTGTGVSWLGDRGSLQHCAPARTAPLPFTGHWSRVCWVSVSFVCASLAVLTNASTSKNVHQKSYARQLGRLCNLKHSSSAVDVSILARGCVAATNTQLAACFPSSTQLHQLGQASSAAQQQQQL